MVGKSAVLCEGQIEEVAKLPVGVGVIYQSNWIEPILCKFEKFEETDFFNYDKKGYIENNDRLKIELIKWLLSGRVSDLLTPDFELILAGVEKLDISTEKKILIKSNLHLKNLENVKVAWYDYKFEVIADLVVNILDCKNDIFTACIQAQTIEELNKLLIDVQKYLNIEDILENIRNEINHCFMKVYSKDNDLALKTYYDWDFQIRNKLI